MKKNQLPLYFVFLIFIFGTFQAIRRGGEDYLVFYHASQLVLQGLGHDIYTDSPDRFLYAPGFAWLMAPLALLPWKVSFPLWCLLKGVSFGAMVRVLARRFTPMAVLLGVLFFARPLLNELRYGQVNLLIVSTFVWALDYLFENRHLAAKKFWSWFAFAIAAVAKLFPAVLIWIAFLPYARSRSERVNARLGIFLGILTLVFVPVLTQGVAGLVEMYQGWHQALLSKGFPTETHNQSFLAFLFHTFSGQTFYSLMRGPILYDYNWFVLPERVLYGLGMLWSGGLGLLILLGCYFSGLRKSFDLALVLLAASVLPSHLIWKPYFVFAIPVAVYVAHLCKTRGAYLVFGLGALLINLSSFDFIGRAWAARLEAHALYLWVMVALMLVALRSILKIRSQPIASYSS